MPKVPYPDPLYPVVWADAPDAPDGLSTPAGGAAPPDDDDPFQLHLDEALVRKADNDAVDQWKSLSGPWFASRGEDAATRWKQIEQSLNEIVHRPLGALETERQRRMYRDIMAPRLEAWGDEARAHATREAQAFNDAASQQRQDLAQAAMRRGARLGDMRAVAEGERRLVGEVRGRSRRQGLASEAASAAEADALAVAHSDVVEHLAQHDPQRAQDWLNAQAGMIGDPAKVDRLSRMLQPYAVEQQQEGLADQIRGETGDLPGQHAAVDAMGPDPSIAEGLKQRLTDMAEGDRRAAEKQKAAFDRVRAAISLREEDDPTSDDFGGDHRNAIAVPQRLASADGAIPQGVIIGNEAFTLYPAGEDHAGAIPLDQWPALSPRTAQRRVWDKTAAENPGRSQEEVIKIINDQMLAELARQAGTNALAANSLNPPIPGAFNPTLRIDPAALADPAASVSNPRAAHPGQGAPGGNSGNGLGPPGELGQMSSDQLANYQDMEHWLASLPSQRNTSGPAATQSAGTLSAAHEGSGPGTVSNGRGDPGGISYGTYQLTTHNVGRFIASPEARQWANEFTNLTPGTPAFGAQWVAIANRDPQAFQAAQDAYMERLFYRPAATAVQTQTGYDFSRGSNAVRNVVWSVAVQHGGAARILSDAVRTTDRSLARTDPNYEQALITNIYNRRARYVAARRDRGLRAARTVPQQRQAAAEARTFNNIITHRYPDEERDAQQMLRRERGR